MENFSVRARERLTDLFDLSGDVLLGESRLELLGRKSVRIENHRGIAFYSETCIRVAAAEGIVSVCGTGLNIDNVIPEEIVLSGHIGKIEFL